MSDIKIINKQSAKSTFRKLIETWATSIIWGLWLYLLLPVINILLWIVGLSTINRNFFENEGYLGFLALVQQMGLSILIAFVIMRLWGIYNYYRFGRLARRTHETTDSIVKLSNFYQLKPHMFLQLDAKKEIIWPLDEEKEDEKIDGWLQEKEKSLTPDQSATEEGTIMMKFHDSREKGIPSITQALLMSLTFVFILALLILFATGGLQKS